MRSAAWERLSVRSPGRPPWALGPRPAAAHVPPGHSCSPPPRGLPKARAVQASDADTKASRLARCRIHTGGFSPFPALQRQAGDEEVAKRPCKKP